jgi:ribonuclease III
VRIVNNIRLFFCSNADKELFYFVNTHLGIKSKNLDLYREALTHKSALVKKETGSLMCNERLEFLGDTILDSVISNYLYKHYPDRDEGFLTQMRSKIVNRKSLNDLGSSIRLESFLISSNLVLKNNNAVGNAFEALIGAIYLDKGYKYTKQFLERKILRKYIDIHFLEKTDTNFKSRLLEVMQQNRHKVQFCTKEDAAGNLGPDIFLSTVIINNEPLCSARGSSKKEAEQNASKLALQKIEQQNFEVSLCV